ncbi:MAG: LysR substrate-binding domain-containing protein [Pseudomonadota bacterium]
MPLRRLPPLNSLRAFEAAARHASFKSAADELAVTPAAVSQQIRALEDDLRVSLFNRGARSVALTREGRRLQSGLTEAFMKMRVAVEGVRAPESEALSITCSGPLATKCLAPRLSRFHDVHPDIAVLIDASFDIESLSAAGPHIALRFGNQPDRNLHAVWLNSERLVPMVSPELAERLALRAPEDIQRAPLIHDESLSTWFQNIPSWADWFASVGLDPAGANRGTRFSSYGDQAIDAAVGGSGVLLGRVGLAATDIQVGRLVCPFGPSIALDLNYYAVCEAGAEETPAIAAFIDWIKQEAESTERALSNVPSLS